jgi:prepilin peptidase CpaA
VWTVNEPHLFHWGVVIGASLVAALIDLYSRRIPNWLTVSVFIAGLAVSLTASGVDGLRGSICASVLMAAPYVVLFLIAGGGAADAKLMGSLGVWLGVRNGVVVLLCVLAAGALLGIGYAIAKRRASSVTANLFLIFLGIRSMVTGQEKWSNAHRVFPDPKNMLTIPYGLCIFSGCCIAAVACIVWHAGIWI